MKSIYSYNEEQRLRIGEKVFTQQLTETAAAKFYDLDKSEVQRCVNLYMRENKIDPVPKVTEPDNNGQENPNYQEMTKDELIKVIMKKDIEVARAKKGYTVKGGGKTKEYITIKNANTK